MPSAKVDFFWDWDYFNFTITRSQGAPKVTPAWKGRSAPKLGPPKSKALPAPSSTPKPPPRPKINAARFPSSLDEKTPKITDVTESEPEPETTKRALQPTSGNPKKIRKLQEKGAAKAKAAPNPAKPSKNVKSSANPQVNGAQ
jgi:hypothetical protein